MGTLRAVIGVLLVVCWLHIVALLICHILLSIVDVPAGIKTWLTAHLRGIEDHGLHGLGEHDIGASSSAEEAEDDKEDDGEDDGPDGVIDP